jgi:hypothetical protein
MASPAKIREALIKLMEAKVGDKVDEAMPGQQFPATSKGAINRSPTPGKPLPGKGETGERPDVLAESLGTKFDVVEEGVRSKKFIKALEEEMDELSTQVPANQLEAIATKNVEDAFDAATPKRKFKSVQERDKVQRGRKAAIKRGDQKYMPRGNKENLSEPPKVFGETSVGTPSEVTDAIDEVSRTASTGKGQKVVNQDQLDDLFGDEQAEQVKAIKKQLNEQGIKRSRVPTERDRAEVLNAARDQVKLKEVDQMAKRVFDQVEDLERTLIMPKGSTDKEIASSGIAQANRRLRNFKREAAQAAARARKSGNVSELIALEDRLTAGLNPAVAPKESLSKTLRLREQRKNKNPMLGHNRPPK